LNLINEQNGYAFPFSGLINTASIPIDGHRDKAGVALFIGKAALPVV
jgi:hypothetical protein